MQIFAWESMRLKMPMQEKPLGCDGKKIFYG